MKRISDYNVINSDKNYSEITQHVNTLNYQGYSADFAFAGNNKIVASTLFDYKLLLLELKKIKNVRFVTHYEFLKNTKKNENEVLIAIRHDIDSDIIAAVQQAELENELGIVSSWYILHTAPYYGFFKDKKFYRHNCNEYYYKKLFELGHEVGLHTDPLLIYQNYNIDGAEAVKVEIKWLRSLGIDIKGTLAHNSKSVYGAFNYEIFKGRNNTDDVEFEGKWAPLGVLDEEQLGLEYEGNELLWQNEMPMEYGAIRNQNEWRWVAHEKKVKSGQIKIDYKFTNQEYVINDIKKIDPGVLVTLVVHPLYYGGRNQINKSPAMPYNSEDFGLNHALGWISYKPLSFQSVTDYKQYHSLNKTNEWGMTDYYIEDQDYSDHIRILVLGADNTHAKRIGIKKNFVSYSSDLINALGLERRVKLFKLAGDGMGIDRLYSWYKKTVKTIKPHIVLVAMSQEIVNQNIPILWAKSEGISLEHPPGDYVRYDTEKNSFYIKNKSKDWMSRQKKRHKYKIFPGTNISIKSILNSDVKYKNMFIKDYILALYEHTINLMNDDDIEIVFYQEDQHDEPNKEVLELSKKIADRNSCDFLTIDQNYVQTNFFDDKTLNISGHSALAETLVSCLKEKLFKLDQSISN